MGKQVSEHYNKIRQVLVVVMILNWAVALAKIIYGYISRSSCISADGFHSFSDGASNIIGLVGITLAAQPRDKDHHYGHKKYETFFSLGIALLLSLVCFELFQEGFRRLKNPIVPKIDIISFIIMIITMAVNIVVMRYEKKKGTFLKSDILVSDAMHTKADIFTSLSVIISLVAIKIGYPIMDPLATLLITVFIGHSAFEIIRESSRILCDSTPISDYKKIEDIVLGVKGVKSCHELRMRGRPDDIYIDIHVLVNPNMHIEDAHKISDVIEEDIKKKMPQVVDVLIHLEPKEK